MKVPFMDLRISNESERNELLSAIETVFKHGRILLGPEVLELEHKVASFCNKKFAVSVSSGTDALFLALKSLGIGKGDEVITTSLSWIATANAIYNCQATPVFADIGDDLNISPESVIKLITDKTKAIIPVHYTGKICQMNEIKRIAKEHNIAIIEDASQAFGAYYYNKPAGSFGTISCFSLNPMKVFAASGEAGIVLTDDINIYNRLIALRHNGMEDRIKCIEPSINGRMDTIQAAILLKRLKTVEEFINRRRTIATEYSKYLKTVVKVPIEKKGERDSFYTYTIRTRENERDELKDFLLLKGIETQIQHPLLMSQQVPFKKYVSDDNKHTEEVVKNVLCLPINEKLSDDAVEYVIKAVLDFYKKHRGK